MKSTLCVLMLCAIAALTSACGADTDAIVSSDRVPSVDLADGIAVCADEGIDSIAASEIEWWLHSSPEAGLDQRITAALEVSIKSSRATYHTGTSTSCESHAVGLAFVRPDGSVNGHAQLKARFTVAASRGRVPHVVVERATLLSAAHELSKLQDAELSAEKLTTANQP